ncbi:alpha-hydroxy acid oxidase [Streptomyces sp. PSAA01]|uniref:alpha-hydroxy acid oxidase n=1 Tax=Streptomyces sp. PSAA01 TaxID=2912762 RepID=UPI001F272D89|nr:alpha-hydroxy acid oxidase [Streptomyces sp. PSAA01]MCG0286187.1 alpha-hydroxy-acid oxidizing protein [Streptomyces sp. PSAA01]
MDLAALLRLADFEQAAELVLSAPTLAYVNGGAGGHRTVEHNRAAFEAVWLRPRVFADTCEAPDTEVTLFGRTFSSPVLLAPTSPQRILHEDAELAVARAAQETGALSIVSTDTHFPFPDIAAAAEDGCWFQLYAYDGRERIAETIEMAEAAGATALVVTADAHYPARRVSAQRAGFRTPPEVDFGTMRQLGILQGDVPASARIGRFPVTWDDLAWIRERTKLPVVVKGVLRAGDARRCSDLGVDGIIVSNHGGRQLDGVLPTLVALDEVVTEVGHERVVLVDGGVRSGTDIVKALALGARAVCVGRPYLWGLAVAGQAGVAAVINLLRLELGDALRQLGVAQVADLDSSFITTATAPRPHPADGPDHGQVDRTRHHDTIVRRAIR